MVLKLSIEEKNMYGRQIAKAIEKNFNKIVSMKPDPEMVYKRVEKAIENLYTQENALRMIRVLPGENVSAILRWTSKLTKLNVVDEHNNNILHILLNKKNGVEMIRLTDLYNLRLWENDNDKGIKPIDLLLIRVMKGEDQSIRLLEDLIAKKMFDNKVLVRHIAIALVERYEITNDIRYENLLHQFKKYYKDVMDKSIDNRVRELLFERQHPNLTRWL